MRKPRKPAAPAKTPPKTDAEALSDIVGWSKSKERPAWQGQALKMLVLDPGLTADQLAALYQLSMDGKAASNPIEETDVRSPKSATAIVNLKAVKNPQDVNALASDQSLSFDQSGLSIVYGDNGAGKSGYARILKQACRARLEPKPAPILTNIYEQAAGEPRARIAYSVNGQSLGLGAPDHELAAVGLDETREGESCIARGHVSEPLARVPVGRECGLLFLLLCRVELPLLPDRFARIRRQIGNVEDGIAGADVPAGAGGEQAIEKLLRTLLGLAALLAIYLSGETLQDAGEHVAAIDGVDRRRHEHQQRDCSYDDAHRRLPMSPQCGRRTTACNPLMCGKKSRNAVFHHFTRPGMTCARTVPDGAQSMFGN